MKIMPVSPEIDLDTIKPLIQKIIEEKGGKNREYEEELVAFGLKALIAFFEWPEEADLEPLENKIKDMGEVNSVQIIDMRKIV